MRTRKHLIMDVSSILKACYFAGKGLAANCVERISVVVGQFARKIAKVFAPCVRTNLSDYLCVSLTVWLPAPFS